MKTPGLSHSDSARGDLGGNPNSGLGHKPTMKVIGVVGLNGSGKDEVVDYLHERYGVAKLSMGDMVREIAEEQGLAPTRDNLHRLSEQYFSERGRDYFAKRAIQTIENHDWETAAISGIRTPTDVETLQQHFGDDFALVHVSVSDPQTRYQRIRDRRQARDPQSYSEFLQHDREEEEIFHLSHTIQEADIVLNNDESLAQLHR